VIDNKTELFIICPLSFSRALSALSLYAMLYELCYMSKLDGFVKSHEFNHRWL